MTLDGKPVRTPARRPLAAPNLALARAIAAEWDAQRDVIDPAAMPLTRLANAIIDGVAEKPGPVAAEIEKYLASDLLFLSRQQSPTITRAPSGAVGPGSRLGARYARRTFQARRRHCSRRPARGCAESCRSRDPDRSVAARRSPRHHDADRFGADRAGRGARRAIRPMRRGRRRMSTKIGIWSNGARTRWRCSGARFDTPSLRRRPAFCASLRNEPSVYPPVTLICRASAGRWWRRSIMKSWPLGLRADRFVDGGEQ